MRAFYVPGMTLGWTRLTNSLSSWGVHGTHPSHCMSLCMLFVSPNNSLWKYCTENNKYKTLWHPLWNYPLQWSRLINQQILLFRMIQCYQTKSQFLHAHLWNLKILSVTLVNRNTQSTSIYFILHKPYVFKRRSFNGINRWVRFWVNTCRAFIICHMDT